MQHPQQQIQVKIEEEKIIYCPKCNANLFSPVFIYCLVQTPLVGQAPQLIQAPTAVKCTECGLILPMTQLNEFTKEKLKEKMDEQRERNSIIQ
jgi:DNA-directed RNA polymerase subunit RPC12/RpoP